jgi:signal transduction histidine kinase
MTKILVIEDEESVRDNIAEILGFEGFEVVCAENGRQGLARVKEAHPDLIICDIAMPELDGYDVLMGIRQMADMAAVPFIFLTARADRPFMRHGMELGADDYLTKPFTTHELLQAIKARLQRHHLIQDELQQPIEHAKQQLVEMVAHELRTPLVSIQMALDIVSRQLEQLSPHQTQDLLHYIEKGSNRLHHLVEQMVFITKLESGALTVETVREYGWEVHISEILVAAVNLARSFASRSPDVRVRLDIRDEQAMVHSDTNVLKHALAEVITNALNFSPAGSEAVVTEWQTEANVCISVVDQGDGIPGDQIANALRQFKQIDRTTHEQQGMGLGLPLARRLIEVHQGTLSLSSVVGRGTQVVIELPRVLPPKA